MSDPEGQLKIGSQAESSGQAVPVQIAAWYAHLILTDLYTLLPGTVAAATLSCPWLEQEKAFFSRELYNSGIHSSILHSFMEFSGKIILSQGDFVLSCIIQNEKGTRERNAQHLKSWAAK